MRFEFHDKPLGDIDLVIKSISDPEWVPNSLLDHKDWYLKDFITGKVREGFIKNMNDIAKVFNPYSVQMIKNDP